MIIILLLDINFTELDQNPLCLQEHHKNQTDPQEIEPTHANISSS